MKLCCRCKTEQPPENFTIDRKRRDGLNPCCRACTREACAQYREANPEVEQARGRRWYEANKERNAARTKAWAQANPERMRGYVRAWQEANPEKNRAAQAKWYLENRAKKLAADKARRESNLDRFLERERASYEKTRDARLSRAKRWREVNQHRVNFYASKRRSALAKRSPPWLTEDHYYEMRTYFWLADLMRVATGEAHHVDHIVPLQGKTVSGLNVPWNLQVLPAIENLKKNNRHAT